MDERKVEAAFYDRFGAAADVLELGEVALAPPGPGEVLVRLRASGINPSDVKLRAGARPGAVMAYPRVVPHSDGAGVVEAVGAGVRLAPGETVLVTGGAGSVGRYACQMAQLMGARVITTVSSPEKAAHSTCAEWINYRETDVAGAVMEMTGGAGVDRIVDVDFAANQALAQTCLKPGGVVASYASASAMEPTLAFYPLMFKDVTLRMLLVYHLGGAARRRGTQALTAWLAAGALSHAVVDGGGLNDIAAAHDLVAAGEKLGTVVLGL